MEEELEKQAAASEQERKQIKANLAKEELRYKPYIYFYNANLLHLTHFYKYPLKG